MARTTPDKRMFTTVGDEAFAAGKPVAASNCRIQARAINHLHQLITGAAQAGETLVLDGSTEYKMPHDHSGTVGGYAHGRFIGRVVYSGLPQIYGILPFSDSAWDIAANVAEATLEFIGESNDAWAPYRRITFAPKSTDTLIVYAGHAPIQVRRGTNTLTVLAEVWGTSADAAPDAVELYSAVFKADWTQLVSTSASIDFVQTATGGLPTASEGLPSNILLTLNLSIDTQTADTQLWLAIGLKATGTASSNNRTAHIFGLTVYEQQT